MASLRMGLDLAGPMSHTLCVTLFFSKPLSCSVPLGDLIHRHSLSLCPWANSNSRLTTTHHPFSEKKFLLFLGSKKSHGFEYLWPGLGFILILDPSPEDGKWDWLHVGCKPIFELGGTRAHPSGTIWTGSR